MSRVKALLDLPRPTTCASCNLSWAYTIISHGTCHTVRMSQPLCLLCCGNLPRGSTAAIVWNSEAETGFQKIKQILCSEPVLVAPDPDQVVHIHFGCFHSSRQCCASPDRAGRISSSLSVRFENVDECSAEVYRNRDRSSSLCDLVVSLASVFRIWKSVCFD